MGRTFLIEIAGRGVSHPPDVVEELQHGEPLVRRREPLLLELAVLPPLAVQLGDLSTAARKPSHLLTYCQQTVYI